MSEHAGEPARMHACECGREPDPGVCSEECPLRRATGSHCACIHPPFGDVSREYPPSGSPAGERVMTLTDFLLARIAEDESRWGSVIDHRGEWDGMPARVLAECKVKRQIVHALGGFFGLDDFSAGLVDYTLKALAAVYANHPDYRDEWRI